MLPNKQTPLEANQKDARSLHVSPLNEGKVISNEEIIKRQFETSPQKGFDLLFRTYYANLCNTAIRFVYSKDLAEDIVAEVFTNFWQNKSYEVIATSYRSYLYKAVRFRAYNVIKYDLQRNDSFDSTKHVAFGSEPVLKPDDILQIHELSQKIDLAIKNLPKQARNAFQMHRLEGKKYSEIATDLGITVSAVERLMSRALSKLREDLKAEWVLLLFVLLFTNP